jgi:ribonuclease I
LKLVARDVSRPNQKYNSKPWPNLIDNELEFEVEVAFKPKQLRGAKVKVLGQVKRIPSNRGILGEWVKHGTCPRSHRIIPQ